MCAKNKRDISYQNIGRQLLLPKGDICRKQFVSRICLIFAVINVSWMSNIRDVLYKMLFLPLFCYDIL